MIFTFFFSVIFAFQISGDTEAAIKLLDKSWIKNVQVRVVFFLPPLVSFSFRSTVCFSVWPPSGLSLAGRSDVLLDASRAAFLHREGVQQLRLLSATGPAMLQLSGQLLCHHQTEYSQMCKSMQTASPLSDSCARNEKHYWAGDDYCASLCPELPMFGGNSENGRLLARRVRQGTCLCLKDDPVWNAPQTVRRRHRGPRGPLKWLTKNTCFRFHSL